MKTIYLECNMGAAGDMLMGALYELCGQKEQFLYKMNEIFAPYGAVIAAVPTTKCGVRGTRMRVTVDGREEAVPAAQADAAALGDPSAQAAAHAHAHAHGHSHADYRSVLARIDGLPLPQEVKDAVMDVYRSIGEAESAVHGVPIEQIHFHEVGTIDAIVDVTGCALLFYMIAPEQVIASPVHVGNGFVRCAHGVLPVPAPATAELLKGIPFYTGSVASELCTPTGAAILRRYVSRFIPMPPLSASMVGYGMGARDFEIVNCIRAFYGDAESDYREEESFSADDTILSISCNIDDMTGEAIGLATEILMAAGALDVYTIPVQMKKNRPGIILTCICELSDREKFTGLFFLHTSTRGVRYQVIERAKLESTLETRKTQYGDIRVKKSSGYGIQKEKPEFEDLKSVVLKNGCALSVDDVAQALRGRGRGSSIVPGGQKFQR